VLPSPCADSFIYCLPHLCSAGSNSAAISINTMYLENLFALIILPLTYLVAADYHGGFADSCAWRQTAGKGPAICAACPPMGPDDEPVTTYLDFGGCLEFASGQGPVAVMVPGEAAE